MADQNQNPAGPEDPFSTLAAGAAGMHEMFLSFVAAGFNADQAFQLVLKAWEVACGRGGGQ